MSATSDLGARGKRLWRNLLKQDPRLGQIANPNREIALQACRIADQLDVLDARMATEDMIVIRVNGDSAINPVWVEFRHLSPLLARLIVSLRLPDAVTGAVPQRRGMRGSVMAQAPGGKVSSLDRARRAAGA